MSVDSGRDGWYSCLKPATANMRDSAFLEQNASTHALWIPLRGCAEPSRLSMFSRIAVAGVLATESAGVSAMSTSKLQETTKERLHTLLTGFDFRENYRPAWLTYPPTGRRLELDFYLPAAKVGIEVQGIQHFEYVPFLQGSEDAFERQKQRDQWKRERCLDQGVFLYEIVTVDDIDGLLEAAKDHCGDLYLQLYYKNCALKSVSRLAAELVRENSRRHSNPNYTDSLKRRILHICSKYNVAPESVRPDFTARKIDTAYFGKQIVKLLRLGETGAVTESTNGAVLRVDGGVAHIRYQIGGFHSDLEVDIETGWQTGTTGTECWRVAEEDLPDLSLTPGETRRVGPQRISLHLFSQDERIVRDAHGWALSVRDGKAMLRFDDGKEGYRLVFDLETGWQVGSDGKSGWRISSKYLGALRAEMPQPLEG